MRRLCVCLFVLYFFFWYVIVLCILWGWKIDKIILFFRGLYFGRGFWECSEEEESIFRFVFGIVSIGDSIEK